MPEFQVRIEIDVTAENHVEAAKLGWELLTAPDAQSPVCEVKLQDGDQQVVDVDLDRAYRDEAGK